MSRKKIAVAAVSTAAIAALVFGGPALASAAGAAHPAISASLAGERGDGGGPRGGPRGDLTEVTGDELAKVTAAVKAKDAAFTVEKAGKAPDGSYLVRGTKDGDRAGYRVSADLATVTERAGRPGGPGPGGPRGDRAEVTGDELAKVTAAVKAKDAAVTVEKVFKSSDGSFHAHGSKDGARVHFDVSADLATVTESTRGPGRGKGPRVS